MKELTISVLKKRRKRDFEKIYNQYYKLVFYVSYNLVKDQELAQDIMQETFVNFMNHVEDYNEEGKIKQYLTTISKNLSLNALKKKVNKEILDEDMILNYSSKDIEMEKVKLKLTLNDTLNEEESKIVTLKILFDYSFKEISENLNQSLGQIQSKYYKALDKLKKHFEKEEF